MASSAALNFQTRFTRTPMGCSRIFGYLRGVSHGQCHVLAGSFGFSFSFSFSVSFSLGGGTGSVFGLATAFHSGRTLPLASAAVRHAGPESFGWTRSTNAARDGPVNHGRASARRR